MTDIREIKIGDLLFVSEEIKDVLIFHKKIGKIKENQTALFLGCEEHRHKKDIFWTVELLVDGKKVMMYTETFAPKCLSKIDVNID